MGIQTDPTISVNESVFISWWVVSWGKLPNNPHRKNGKLTKGPRAFHGDLDLSFLITIVTDIEARHIGTDKV
jgi:hypothetical protein